MTRDRFLTLYLRLIGTVASLAAICAVMPLRWMDTIHRAIGMGTLPDRPIVEYLARSTSAFYALMGALFWMLSFDLVRYRLLVKRLGMAIIALGIMLLWTDIMAGMPWFWQAIEGPANVVLGAIILWAARNPFGTEHPSNTNKTIRKEWKIAIGIGTPLG